MHRQTYHQSPTLRKQVSQRKNKTGKDYNTAYHEHEPKECQISDDSRNSHGLGSSAQCSNA